MHQHPVGGGSLAGVAGDGIAVIARGMFVSVEVRVPARVQPTLRARKSDGYLLSLRIMTDDPLDGIKLKLIRAQKHLDDVMGILSLIKVGECCITPERSEKLGLLVQRISIQPKPPLELSVVIGDFLFGVRSALDHLIWQLVIHNGRSPTARNMFPITSAPALFNAAVTERRRLEGVSPKACAIIESLQPYHIGNEALGRLDTLHNVDKHRALNLTTVVADNTSLLFSTGGHPVLRMFIGDEELRDGAVFGGIGIPLNSPEFSREFPEAIRRISEADVKGKASLFVAFDEAEGEVESLENFRVDNTLQNILEFVRGRVIVAIEPLFG